MSYPCPPLSMVLASDIYEPEEKEYIETVIKQLGYWDEYQQIQFLYGDENDDNSFTMAHNIYLEFLERIWPIK